MSSFEAGKLVGQVTGYLLVVVVGIIIMVRMVRKNKKNKNEEIE